MIHEARDFSHVKFTQLLTDILELHSNDVVVKDKIVSFEEIAR